MFELKERCGLARLGRFKIGDKEMVTPALLPVVNPRIHTVAPREIRERFHAEALITNSYIIYKDSSLRQEVLERGIHDLLDFDGFIFTDSGAFQSHMYGKVSVENLEIVDFQREIGSDVGTALDLFTEPEDGMEKVKSSVEETLRRTGEAVKRKGEMLLMGTVQGGIFPELREGCARELSRLDIDVQAIGGVVPLMESYRFKDVVDVVMASRKGLRPSRPVHLFGAGHPMLFSLAVLMGCDLFDSSSYAKYARDGRMMFPFGTRRRSELRERLCDCPACLELETCEPSEEERLIALHNLYVSFAEVSRIRQSIADGTLWELVEQRCRSHPMLLEALRTLSRYREFMERYESLSETSAFLYTGAESYERPIVRRIQARILERYRPPRSDLVVIFPEAEKPYSRTFRIPLKDIVKREGVHAIVFSLFGPVPIELDEVYPVAQSLVPSPLDPDVENDVHTRVRQFVEFMEYEEAVWWREKETADIIQLKKLSEVPADLDEWRVAAVADLQFGPGAAKALLDGDLKLVKSKRTGKVRNVFVDGLHILSMRAHDGYFTLKAEGAKRLHKAFNPPWLRVVVEDEAAEFSREGKSVFAKFVVECDPELRPRDEVLVVNESDELCAVGQTRMNREEMLDFEVGMAVRVREGIPP